MSVAVVVVVVTLRPMHMWVLRIQWAMAMIVVCMVVMSMCIAMTMAMVVTTPMLAIGTVFGFETFTHLVDNEVHGTQHIGQHMVGFDFQVIGLQFNGYMAVAQVIGGAGQVKRRAVRCAMGDAQHALWRGQHLEQRAVFAHQHIATTHHLAALQKHAYLPPSTVGGFKAAFLPHIPV